MAPQTTIAHYRITAKLGEGGMGAVYRATDTKLNRDVAIKVLPDAFAQDPERLARFTREAQVLASLNHANIAAIYGVEERALVLELVEGPTLAERIDAGAIPLEDALPIARQIAEALEYAHEKGIVHRDLKPANIKITPQGHVKVLDFGLAKALAEEAVALDPRSSPTITMQATRVGAIMGTAAYMSPEQAKGKPVDRRADIWSFGVVLVEMLTGKPFYSAETIPETIAAVLLKEPDWSGIPLETPAAIRTLIKRCLEKEPRRRLQAIGEARLILEDPGITEPLAPAAPVISRSGPRWFAMAAAVAVALVLGAGWWRASRPVERPLLRFSADLGSAAVRGSSITTVISPDGARIAFPIQTHRARQIATQLLSESKSTSLPGTENGFNPFFSRDGEWIGFFDDSKLKKISVHGGAAITLCDAPNGRGAAWGDDGNIVASLDGVDLSIISAAGGTPRVVAKAKDLGVRGLRFPQVLPGAEFVMATAAPAGARSYDDGSIVAISVKAGKTKVVHNGGYFGRYLPSGHLIYVNQGALFAMPFDLSRLEGRGAPAPVLDGLAANPSQGGGQLDVSDDGILMFLQGESVSLSRATAWMSAAGTTNLIAAKGINLRLSPDGKRLALVTETDLSVYNLERSVSSRLTFQADRYPVWTPDGKHIIYVEAVTNALMLIRSDGSGKPVQFERPGGVSLGLPTFAIPMSISPDSRHLAVHAGGSATNRDIFILPVDLTDPSHPKVGAPQPFVTGPGPDVEGVFSPDGKWMAYTAFESGEMQVVVRPFPSAQGGKWQVSTSPGRSPAWSRNGKELFYLALDGHIMVASYTTVAGAFVPGAPRPWSPTPIQLTSTFTAFDVHPDGKRLIVNPRSDSDEDKQSNVHATFVLNFFDELKRRVK